MAGRKWTSQEDEFLIENYSQGSKQKLLDGLPRRTWDSIKLHAERLGLKYHSGVHPYVQANLGNLLQDTPLAFYWMGFLVADGYFSKKHLKLTLSKKDKEHVVRFADFIECRNHGPTTNGYGLKIQDSHTIPRLSEKFDLKRAKTYNPPDIRWMERDLFVAFCVGFFDGDGCIKFQSGRSDCVLQVKTHRSWLNNLQFMSNVLSEASNVNPVQARINNAGYASVCWANSVMLRYLKGEAGKLKLPVLSRKWDRIDETRPNRYEIAKSNRQVVLGMAKRGLRNKDIAQKLSLSFSGISRIIKELKQGGLL